MFIVPYNHYYRMNTIVNYRKQNRNGYGYSKRVNSLLVMIYCIWMLHLYLETTS